MLRASLIALFALLAVASANHDLIVGHRQQGDTLLKQKQIDVDWKLLQKVKHLETIDGSTMITRVEIIDLKQKETSATPVILTGGPGHEFVSIKFTSERGHGIHFLVKVYGKSASRPWY